MHLITAATSKLVATCATSMSSQGATYPCSGLCQRRKCYALAAWPSFSSGCCAQLSKIGGLATQMPVVSVPGASEPLCRAPQMVEGTTFIYAQPGRARELATILESMPMSVRKRAPRLWTLDPRSRVCLV